MIPNSLTFYRIYIEFESENRVSFDFYGFSLNFTYFYLVLKDNESAAAVRMAYEAAVTEHGKEDSSEC